MAFICFLIVLIKMVFVTPILVENQFDKLITENLVLIDQSHFIRNISIFMALNLISRSKDQNIKCSKK
ncbi:hypothetical protein BpHYR1_012288 [Brachionus plicatilis]|uniref:Uncharacterized protein n=1 Tax=Brachionus plicatilis TaxID=10195 RepID=A0A3M7PVR5_BRAPC|nr:hypothetical protein BpHYR1_012288 [Brachionus plicatilis]